MNKVTWHLSLALLCAVFALSELVLALLSERALQNLRQHHASSPVSGQVEQENSRNRAHVWEWLDRIHNERRNKTSSPPSKKDFSFVFATAKPQVSAEDESALKNEVARTKKLPRDAIGDSSIELDYADETPSTRAEGSTTDQNLFDQLKTSMEPRKLSTTAPTPTTTTSGMTTVTGTSISSRPRSSSFSSVLKFSSNRTNASKSPSKAPFVSINQKNQKKRTSSVLNLPPVKQDWSFTCPAGKSGYFADADNDCRVYYVCSSDRGERQRFVCPTGTRFNQHQANCDWWDKVDCQQQALS